MCDQHHVVTIDGCRVMRRLAGDPVPVASAMILAEAYSKETAGESERVFTACPHNKVIAKAIDRTARC